MAKMTYLQAISDAMREEMRADENVFVMGEDIGTFGGAFKVTDGFIDEFGASRVMDTPLAESGIIGTAIGASLEGMRPIAEMQFSDFIACGFDQLVNVAGKMYYRQGLSVNITVRLPSGDHRRVPSLGACTRGATRWWSRRPSKTPRACRTRRCGSTTPSSSWSTSTATGA